VTLSPDCAPAAPTDRQLDCGCPGTSNAEPSNRLCEPSSSNRDTDERADTPEALSQAPAHPATTQPTQTTSATRTSTTATDAGPPAAWPVLAAAIPDPLPFDVPVPVVVGSRGSGLKNQTRALKDGAGTFENFWRGSSL
jgi:hypothetical protein